MVPSFRPHLAPARRLLSFSAGERRLRPRLLRYITTEATVKDNPHVSYSPPQLASRYCLRPTPSLHPAPFSLHRVPCTPKLPGWREDGVGVAEVEVGLADDGDGKMDVDAAER